MNPNGTVPVLRDGTNAPLWETGCILRYLAEAYGSEAFWPKDLISRTGIDRWAEWSKINVALLFTVPVFWRVVRTKKADMDIPAINKAVSTLEEKLAIANTQLETRPFLVGGSPDIGRHSVRPQYCAGDLIPSSNGNSCYSMEQVCADMYGEGTKVIRYGRCKKPKEKTTKIISYENKRIKKLQREIEELMKKIKELES